MTLLSPRFLWSVLACSAVGSTCAIAADDFSSLQDTIHQELATVDSLDNHTVATAFSKAFRRHYFLTSLNSTEGDQHMGHALLWQRDSGVTDKNEYVELQSDKKPKLKISVREIAVADNDNVAKRFLVIVRLERPLKLRTKPRLVSRGVLIGDMELGPQDRPSSLDSPFFTEWTTEEPIAEGSVQIDVDDRGRFTVMPQDARSQLLLSIRRLIQPEINKLVGESLSNSESEFGNRAREELAKKVLSYSPPHQNLWVNSGSGRLPRLW